MVSGGVLMTTLKEIILYPTESKVKLINDLIKNEVNTLAEVIEETIDANNPKGMYLVAKYVEGIDLGIIYWFANSVCQCKNPEYIYKFAQDIPGAPIDRLAKGMLATKHLNYIYKYAKDIPGAPLDNFITFMARAHESNYLLEMAINIKGINKEKIVDAILDIGTPEVIDELVVNVPNVDMKKAIKKFEEAVKSHEKIDIGVIFYFIRDYKDVMLEDEELKTILGELCRHILILGESKWIYLLALVPDIVGCGSYLTYEDFAFALINANYNEFDYALNICLFAKEFQAQNIPLNDMIDALINSKNYDCLIDLMLNITSLPMEDLINFIEENVSQKRFLYYMMIIVLKSESYVQAYMALERIKMIKLTEPMTSLDKILVLNNLLESCNHEDYKLFEAIKKVTAEIEDEVISEKFGPNRL